MPEYLKGVIIAFAEPVFHGACNIVDHFLSAKVFPRMATLVFFSVSVYVLLLPVVAYISPPHLLSPLLLFIAFCIALIEFIYHFPYYYALREVDTSVVASLFSLGRVFIPIVAYFVVGERLSVLQYVGFILITIASFALTFDHTRLRLNKAFFLMFFVSFILVIQTILYKYAFASGASWGSVVVSMTLCEFVIAVLFFFISGAFRSIGSDLVQIRKAGWMFGLNEMLGWMGNTGDSFGVSILPATIARSISSTQPMFSLTYAYLFKEKIPEIFREELEKRDIAKKLTCYVLTIVGVVLVVAFGSNGE